MVNFPTFYMMLKDGFFSLYNIYADLEIENVYGQMNYYISCIIGQRRYLHAGQCHTHTAGWWIRAQWCSY